MPIFKKNPQINIATKTKTSPLLYIGLAVAIFFPIFLGNFMIFAMDVIQNDVRRPTPGQDFIIACPTEPVESLDKRPERARGRELAATLDSMTREISQAHALYKQTGGRGRGVAREELQKLAQERKKLFIDAGENNPDVSIFSILTPEERNSLQSLTRNCVEEEVTLDGRLEVRHTDWLDGASTDTYALTTLDGRKYRLYPAGKFREAVLSGMQL